MPIINRKNNNKHNIVTNTTPATSAKASATISFPWNVLQEPLASSFQYLTVNPVYFIAIQDIHQNMVQIIIDPTLSYDSQGYLELIDGIYHARIGIQGLDLSISANHDTFLQNFVTVFNNVKVQLSFKITASLVPNTNTVVFEHSNVNIGSFSNSHLIITDWQSSGGNITLTEILATHSNISVNNNYVLAVDESVNIVSFDFLEKEQKSGSVTIGPKNKIKTKKRTLLPKKLTHSKFKRENLNISFNDNKSVVFSSETINTNTRVSSSSTLNDLIVSSPNTFDLNFSNLQKTTKPEFVDYYLEDFQEENSIISPFSELSSFYENKEGDFKNEEEIEINLNFDIPAILCNNRTSSPQDLNTKDGTTPQRYEEVQKIQFPISVNNSSIEETVSVKRHSAPTAYYNFKENRWDYLGNIKRPTYLEQSQTFSSYEISDPNSTSREGFDKIIDSYEGFTEISDTDEKIISFLKNNNICFSGVTNDYSLNIFRSESSAINEPSFFDIVNKHAGSVGSPIGNFGFPFSEKYEPLNSHLINLKDYIHKDFHLKKVVYDGEFSCFLPGKSLLEVGEEAGAANIEAGGIYRIISIGNTDFSLIGGSNVVGSIFVATGSGFGTGTVEKYYYGGRRIGLSNISFFLINNRKNLNDSYFDSLESQQSNSIGWDESSLNNQNEYTSLSIKRFPETENTKFKITDENGLVRKFSYFKSEDSIVGKEIESGVTVNKLIYGAHVKSGQDTAFSNPSQRDLITYNNIVNFCSGSIQQSNKYFCVDYDKVKREADMFVELDPYHNNSFDSIEEENDNSSSYYKRNIQVVSNVKTGTKQNDFSIYSYFPTLLSNNHGKRTLYSYNSGRSDSETYVANSNDFYTSKFIINPTMTTSGSNNLTIESNSFNNSFIEDEYILKPEDTVFLGVSLTNSFNNYMNLNENLGDDVFIIHSLKMKLIGSYKNKGKNKYSTNYVDNNNNIKYTVIGDNDLFDEFETTPYQLLSNYHTRIYDYHGIGSSYLNKNQKINSTDIFFSSLSTNESIYDTIMNNVLDVIEVDNKKLIDSEWPGNNIYTGAQNLRNYLVVVPQNHPSPTEYENENWTYSYPFEEKYKNIVRSFQVNYESLNLKGIADTLETSPSVGDMLKIFPDNPLFKDMNKSTNNYFYSYNRKNTNMTRMPVAIKTSGNNPPESWFNDEWSLIIDGFRLGVLNPNLVYNTVSYSNKKYGNFSDKINRNINYATLNEEGDIVYTVIKKFLVDYIPVHDTSILENTYNKDKHARLSKPFVDASASDLV